MCLFNVVTAPDSSFYDSQTTETLNVGIKLLFTWRPAAKVLR